jgi:hypothetical protein
MFVGAGAEANPNELPLFRPPCPFSFSQRIQLICKIILQYHRLEPATSIYKGLAVRLTETIS